MQAGASRGGRDAEQAAGQGRESTAPEPAHSCVAPQKSTDFNSSLASVRVYWSRQEDGTQFTVSQLD